MVPVPASANDAEGTTVRSDQAEHDQLNVALFQSERELSRSTPTYLMLLFTNVL
jgi:hypothetical protein